MGAAAAISSVAISQVGGAYLQSKAQKTQGQYQKAMYDQNAKLADLSADDALRRGDKEVISLKKQGKQIIGAQRAALAAQGIEVDSGSALDVQVDTAYQVELDAMKIKNNAWREAWGYKTEALNARTQGTFAALGAKNAATNTLITGGLGAATSVASNALAYKGRG